MYIRRTLTRTLANGAQYYSHRLVRSERVGGRVRQVTLLNLGSDFTLGATQWEALCARIEGLLAGDDPGGAVGEAPAVELEAQRVAALLLARQSRAVPRESKTLESLDIATLKVSDSRSVGVEQVALWAIGELRLAEQLRTLGMPQRHVAAVLGLIVAGMAEPGVKGAALLRWGERSALGELLGVDFLAFDPLLPERAAVTLLKHRKVLESHLQARLGELAGDAAGEPVYHLMIRPCESAPCASAWGAGRRVLDPSAGPGLLVLGLVCDRRGFIRRWASFAGARAAGRHSKRMLEALGAPAGALVALAEGAYPAAECAWVLSQGYRAWAHEVAGQGEDGTQDVALTLVDLIPILGRAGPVPDAVGRESGGHEADAASLFISVLAYQCVWLIRHRLAPQGISDDWRHLRQVLGRHCRVTVSVACGDGRTLHLRQPTSADSAQLAIYQALATDAIPGGVQSTLV